MEMKKVLLGGVAAIALGAGLLLPAPSKADAPGTSTTQTATHLDAAQGVAGTTATNCTTTQVSTANLTLTITPQAGQYVYLTGFYVQVGNNSTGANSQAAWSSTNLTGAPAWFMGEQAAALAETIEVADTMVYKSTAPGTAVTLVPTATLASAYVCARAYYYTNAN